MKKQNKQIKLKAVVCLFCLLNVCLLGFYLIQTGELTETGYLIKACQKTVITNSGQTATAQGQLNNAVDFLAVEHKILAMGFVPSQQVTFIPRDSKYLTLVDF